MLAPGGDRRLGLRPQWDLAGHAGLTGCHPDVPSAGGDGDVGVIESGEFTFSQSGIEGQCYQGVVACAAALSGAQQTPLLVLGKRPVRGCRSPGGLPMPCVSSAMHWQYFKPPGDAVSRNTPR